MMDNGVWLSISDLARERGADKSSVSRRVSRLESRGLLTTRVDGKTKLVNAAEYDRVLGQVGDAIKEQAARSGSDDAAPGLASEQTRRTAYMAELARLDLEERLGKLLPLADVEAAMVRCAAALVRVIDQLPGRSDDPQIKPLLKAMARELRETLEREMRLTAATQVDDGPEATTP